MAEENRNSTEKEKPPLYIPPEIWENIISHLDPIKKCVECNQEYCEVCRKRSSGDHINCKLCDKFLCLNNPSNPSYVTLLRCMHCRVILCQDCTVHRLVTKDNATYHKCGCPDCVDIMEQKIMNQPY